MSAGKLTGPDRGAHNPKEVIAHGVARAVADATSGVPGVARGTEAPHGRPDVEHARGATAAGVDLVHDQVAGASPPAAADSRCAFCGGPAQGHFSIHRDGFGCGPEVPLCDACGADERPTTAEIWDAISTYRWRVSWETPLLGTRSVLCLKTGAEARAYAEALKTIPTAQDVVVREVRRG